MEPTQKNELTSSKTPFEIGGMFQGADPFIFELARDLRKNLNDAERVLWMYVREGVRGLKFRRQHPVGVYIADFYWHKIKLLIEADGLIHDRPDIKEYHQKRERELQTSGNDVLCLTDKEILTDSEKVLEKIKFKVEALSKNLIIN